MKKNSERNLLWFLLSLVLSLGCANASQTTDNRNQSVSNINNNQSVHDSNVTDKSSITKTYDKMSDDEKSKFIAEQADKILDKFGRTEGDKISDEGLKAIKTFVDSYARRVSPAKSEACSFGNDLTAVLTRGSKYAADIRNEFSKEGLPSQIGIYLPMIESEYCPCLQSPTGLLGMFQLTAKTGQDYGLKIKQGASPTNPDERCDPQLASSAAAKYLKSTMAKNFPDDMNAIGYPFLISLYNAGENDKYIKAITESKKISYWAFAANQGKSSSNSNLKQFQIEGVKYVPKFFAAAIIGENPRVFGVDLAALSETPK